MNPVQAPHHVRCQMEWTAIVPVVIYVVTQIVHVLWHFLRWRRLMLAAINEDWYVAPPSCFSFEILYRDTIQLLNRRGPKTKTLRLAQRFVDDLHHPVIPVSYTHLRAHET